MKGTCEELYNKGFLREYEYYFENKYSRSQIVSAIEKEYFIINEKIQKASLNG